MKKLLLTGFVPFLDNPINPTEKIVKELDGATNGDYHIYGRVLPVEFAKSADTLFAHYDEIRPDAVICLGLAAGRNRITPERVAINCNDGEPDNSGVAPEDQPIDPEGPAAYFSTLPIRRFVNTLNQAGLPAEISNTAGTYLCNNVMYSILNKIAKEGGIAPAGFVHIPASHELAVNNRALPSWSHDSLLQAVKLMIEVL